MENKNLSLSLIYEILKVADSSAPLKQVEITPDGIIYKFPVYLEKKVPTYSLRGNIPDAVGTHFGDQADDISDNVYNKLALYFDIVNIDVDYNLKDYDEDYEGDESYLYATAEIIITISDKK